VTDSLSASIVGRTISHYRIVEMIGVGGMGVVYRAHDEELDRDVALKFLPAGTLSDEAARKRFRKEALILAKLNHPNVATIHEFVTQDGIDFLVMEYVSGKSLAEEYAGEVWPEKQLIAAASQIAHALQEAHERGVIHRDLKPSNVMITPKGLTKVLDFGLAGNWRPVSEKTTIDARDEPRVVAGTLPYMAPEQLLGNETDARTDVYGLGALLYQMATGRQPFQDKVAARLIDTILHEAPSPPQTLNRHLSLELERIIVKCLEKDPENRYQSAKELDVDLRRMQSASFVSPAPVSRKSSQRWVIITTTGCAIIIASAIGFGVHRFRDRFAIRPGAPQIQSLAVLPLENLSHDPEQEYFAEGMTDELITQLAQISALRVISKTSVMPYRGSHKPLSEIANELGVDAVVEGSVMRSGNRVRINAQLIQASTDKNLWAKGYERDLTDVLGLQNEVARDVTREIRVELTSRERVRLTHTAEVSPEAHDAYLRGRYYWDKATADDYYQAERYFAQAIQIDPNYAAAYSGLADFFWATDELAPQVAMPKAKENALKALAIDDSLSAAHTTLADVKFYGDWDWLGAEREYKRAIELNPNDAEAHRMYSVFLSAMDREKDALEEIRSAQALDPISAFTSTSAGWAFFFARKYDQAIEQCKKALDLEPNAVDAHACLGDSYLARGDFGRAIPELKRAATLSGNDALRLTRLGRAYALAGRPVEARKMLGELLEEPKRKYVPPYFPACIHVALDEKGEALSLLEQGYRQRDSYLTWLKVEPAFDPLRSDPRFRDLLKRINFPD